jgi:hypothetical protein
MTTIPSTTGAAIQCAQCGTLFPAAAKFCPRCGREVEEGQRPPPVLEEKWPSNKGRTPLAGLIFFAALVIGPALIVGGIWFQLAALLWAGLFVAVCVIVFLILGMFF